MQQLPAQPPSAPHLVPQRRQLLLCAAGPQLQSHARLHVGSRARRTRRARRGAAMPRAAVGPDRAGGAAAVPQLPWRGGAGGGRQRALVLRKPVARPGAGRGTR